MVFEHLQDLFDLKDSIIDFPHLFLVCSYVVVGRIFESITKALGVASRPRQGKVDNRLLPGKMVKVSGKG
jgi:hypothetical protein